MGGFKKAALLFVIVTGFEVAREVYVLKLLGFQPDKFISWLKG